MLLVCWELCCFLLQITAEQHRGVVPVGSQGKCLGLWQTLLLPGLVPTAPRRAGKLRGALPTPARISPASCGAGEQTEPQSLRFKCNVTQPNGVNTGTRGT